MAMTQLVLEHCQQVCNHVEPLVQQAHPLIHFKIAPHCLVDGLELGLYPEELRGIQDRAVEVDGDAEDEEVADLHVDLFPGEVDFPGEGDVSGYVFAGVDGCGY